MTKVTSKKSNLFIILHRLEFAALCDLLDDFNDLKNG